MKITPKLMARCLPILSRSGHLILGFKRKLRSRKSNDGPYMLAAPIRFVAKEKARA